MIFGRAFLELFVVGTLAWVAGSEPVKSCLKEETFQRADCKTVREHVSGTWIEVRRLKLPFAMYEDDDCVTWDVFPTKINESIAEYNLIAHKDNDEVEGMDPAVLTLSTDESGACSVSMHLTIPKISKSVSINDWWITFDESRQGMVGYVCLPNNKQEEIDAGFPFKNMMFIYTKPQWRPSQVEQVKISVMEIVDRLSEELKYLEEETEENYKELKEAKCDGI